MSGRDVSVSIIPVRPNGYSSGYSGMNTLQVFVFSYFAGIFGFPLIAGWVIVEIGSAVLLTLIAFIAAIEASVALRRAMNIDLAG